MPGRHLIVVEPKVGEHWRTRDGVGLIPQVGRVVRITDLHVIVRVTWGDAFVAAKKFVRDWEPDVEEDEPPARYG